MPNGNGQQQPSLDTSTLSDEEWLKHYGVAPRGQALPPGVTPAVQPPGAQPGAQQGVRDTRPPWYVRYPESAAISTAGMLPFAIAEASAAPATGGLSLVPAAATLGWGALSGIGSQAMEDLTYDPQTGKSPWWAGPAGGLIGGGWATGARTLLGAGGRGLQAISQAARGNPLAALGVGTGAAYVGGTLAEHLLEGSHLAAYAMQHPIQTAAAVAAAPLFARPISMIRNLPSWSKGVWPELTGAALGGVQQVVSPLVQQGVNQLYNPMPTGGMP